MADRKPRPAAFTQRPWLRWSLIVSGIALLALAGWGLYSNTRANTVSGSQRARSERDQLRDGNRSLSQRLRAALAENQQFKAQLAYIKQSGQIDNDACTLVKESLGGMQQENSSLREQLAFYRGIVSPKQSSEGLRVYDLKVTRSAHEAQQYDFELLLIQPRHHDHLVDGKAKIVISGLLNGVRHSYPLSGMIVAGHKNLLFSFKYFQELDGSFRLPAGFRPIRVTVTLIPDSDKPKVEQSYDWSRIERAAGGS